MVQVFNSRIVYELTHDAYSQNMSRKWVVSPASKQAFYYTESNVLWCVFLTVPQPTLKELVTVRVRDWYNLGLQLDIDDYDLHTIRHYNNRDPESSTRAMFRTWLNSSPHVSYKQLTQALIRLGDVREADRICKEYGEPY